MFLNLIRSRRSKVQLEMEIPWNAAPSMADVLRILHNADLFARARAFPTACSSAIRPSHVRKEDAVIWVLSYLRPRELIDLLLKKNSL